MYEGEELKHEKSEILAITYRERYDVIRQRGAQVKVSIQLRADKDLLLLLH
jgi:hypothetical protein